MHVTRSARTLSALLVVLAIGAVGNLAWSGSAMAGSRTGTLMGTGSAARSSGASIALPTGGPFPPVRAPGAFVAARPLLASISGPSAITVNNAATGSVAHILMPTSWHGMQANATAVDKTGWVWVTLASSPRCTNDTFTCGFVPGSCAGQVLRLDPKTGKAMPMVTASPDELISDAQPSPNGRYLAYLDGKCSVPSTEYVRVRDLATGRSWTIGRRLSACTTLGSLAWSASGNDLAVEYGPSACKTRPNELAIVPALRPAAGLPGRRVRMDANCQADAVAATRTGYAAIEACGAHLGYRTGPASLLLFNSTLKVTSRSSVGSCLGTDAELSAASKSSDLLIATHQFSRRVDRPTATNHTAQANSAVHRHWTGPESRVRLGDRNQAAVLLGQLGITEPEGGVVSGDPLTLLTRIP